MKSSSAPDDLGERRLGRADRVRVWLRRARPEEIAAVEKVARWPVPTK